MLLRHTALTCSLDYPGIGPEHSYLSELGRAEYFAVTDQQALDAFVRVSRLEGIIPALETSHAFAYLEVGTATCQTAFGGRVSVKTSWVASPIGMVHCLCKARTCLSQQIVTVDRV